MLSKLEIRRQLFHFSLGIALVLLLYFKVIGKIALILLTLTAFFISYLLKNGYKIPLLQDFIERFQRKREKEDMPIKGAVFYLCGVTLSVIFFPMRIALASILTLAIGDSVSRIVGPYGYLKHPFNSSKFVEGILAGGVAAAFAAWIFVPFVPAITGAVAAMFIEGLDVKVNGMKVDDNLTIPLSSALVILLVGLI